MIPLRIRPGFAMYNLFDCGAGGSVLFTQSHQVSFAAVFCCILSNSQDHLFAMFAIGAAFAVALGAMTYCVGMVGFSCVPTKISEVIVCGVTITVTAFQSLGTRTEKGCSYERMDVSEFLDCHNKPASAIPHLRLSQFLPIPSFEETSTSGTRASPANPLSPHCPIVPHTITFEFAADEIQTAVTDIHFRVVEKSAASDRISGRHDRLPKADCVRNRMGVSRALLLRPLYENQLYSDRGFYASC